MQSLHLTASTRTYWSMGVRMVYLVSAGLWIHLYDHMNCRLMELIIHVQKPLFKSCVCCECTACHWKPEMGPHLSILQWFQSLVKSPVGSEQ
jgi:hypothetical protein